ncbi:2-oxoglutarate synthase subunit, 2-oxoacid-ferredoxin oxidoreductase subunit B [Klebsiella michiganensis]|nr:2-oxoglutarate synthase subunit, 2-oxoacid-ferredoxin oxidoreductase subunit B [Klebsiella michiganensis]
MTSGTATANLYPALIEAGLTGEKLILLTADRPPELIDCGANQAIRQPGMFASHPSQTLSLPRPSQDISARWLVSTLDQALGALHCGGVHINCPFAEPLYGDMDDTGAEWQQQLGDWWQSDKPWLRHSLHLESEKQRDWFFWRQKRGVVVAGRMRAEEGVKVAEWAKTLGWPLIGDVLSQTGQPLPCADLWLGNGKAVSELAQAQIIVQLGSSLTSKRVLQWQATCEPEEYWLVDNLPGRLDPAQHRGRRTGVRHRTAGLNSIRRKNDSRGPPSFPSFRAGHGRRRSPAARISARPSWRSESGAICRIRASCSSATAWWCA